MQPVHNIEITLSYNLLATFTAKFIDRRTPSIINRHQIPIADHHNNSSRGTKFDI